MTKGREGASEGFDILTAVDQLATARDTISLVDGPASRRMGADIDNDIASITQNPVFERAFRLSAERRASQLSGRVALDNTTQGE
jgi:hypothetical protein